MSQAKAQAAEALPYRISARLHARANGQTKYQGRPCPRGHPGMRYTSNCACIICIEEDNAMVKLEHRQAYLKAYWKRPEVQSRRNARRRKPTKSGVSNAQ